MAAFGIRYEVQVIRRAPETRPPAARLLPDWRSAPAARPAWRYVLYGESNGISAASSVPLYCPASSSAYTTVGSHCKGMRWRKPVRRTLPPPEDVPQPWASRARRARPASASVPGLLRRARKPARKSRPIPAGSASPWLRPSPGRSDASETRRSRGKESLRGCCASGARSRIARRVARGGEKFVAARETFPRHQIRDIKHRIALGNHQFAHKHAPLSEAIKHIKRRLRMVKEIFPGLQRAPRAPAAERLEYPAIPHHALARQQPRDRPARRASWNIHIDARRSKALIWQIQRHPDPAPNQGQPHEKNSGYPQEAAHIIPACRGPRETSSRAKSQPRPDRPASCFSGAKRAGAVRSRS